MRSGRMWLPICLLTVGLLAAWPALAAEVAADGEVDGEVFTLGEVIVSSEEQVVNLATTVTEVTAEDMKQRGARTLAEALELLPGVDVARSSSKNESFVQIRGFNDQDVKILIDGVPVYEQYSRQLDLAQIPTSQIAKITVVKGASSVLYGSNTLGGVINVITKKAGSKPTATATAAWGDYGTQEYSFGAGAPLGDFNVWAGYSYRHSDGWKLSDDYDTDWWGPKEDDGGKRDMSDYLQHTFNAKVGFEPDEDTSLYLTFDYHDNEKGVPTRQWFFPHWKQWHLNLVGQQQFTDWLKIKARVFYADHEDTLYFPRWDELSAYDNYSVGGEVQSFMDFGRWSFLKFGYTFQRDNCEQTEKVVGTAGWTDAGEYEADTYTFALEDEIRPLDWLAFVIGASYDYYDPRKAGDMPVPDSIDSFNPQIGAVVNLGEMTTLHGSVGKKIRFPHLKELYSDMAGGNPDLDPQETITYEIGLNHAFNDRITLSVAAFYNDIEDLIEQIDVDDPNSPDPDDTLGVYVNIGEATTKGVEVSLGADITDRFWVGANYTYLRTEDKDKDRELEGRPRHRINLDMRYAFSFGLSTAMQISYVNRQFYDNRGDWTRTPDYLLLNARVEQRLGELWGVEGSAFFEITNLTDRDYYEVGRPTPGRNFLAGLNFTY